MLAGQEEEGWGQSRALLTQMQALADEDQDIRIDHAVAYGMLMRDLSHLAWHREQDAYAVILLDNSIRYLSGTARVHPESRRPLIELAYSYFHAWDHGRLEAIGVPAAIWVARIREALNLSGCVDLDIVARLNLMEGRHQAAQSQVDRLLDRGYQEPEFRQFCASHGLCVAGN